MDLISITEAAMLLRVHPSTLRRSESPDGNWCLIAGQRLRVYKLSSEPNGHRRYDRDEIIRKFLRSYLSR